MHKHSKTLIALSVALLAGSCSLLGSSQTTKSKTTDDTAKELEVLTQRWLDAARNKDVAYLTGFFADNFVERHANGEVVDKSKQISQIQASLTHIVSIHADDIKVRFLSADVAVLTDITTIDGVSEGVSKTGVYQVLRVFTKVHGKWMAAAAGLTPVAKPAVPLK